MRIRIFSPAFVLLAVAAGLLTACKDPETEPEDGAVFQINGVAEDSYWEISPEAQQVKVDVYLSKGKWSWYMMGNPPEWIENVEEKNVGKQKGSVTLTISELESPVPRSVLLVFQAGHQMRKLTLKQSPPDPFHLLTTPGAYGVPGGDRVYEAGNTQISVFRSSEGFSFRLLEPDACEATILTFRQTSFRKGQVVSFLLREVEKGLTTVSDTYQDVVVTQVSDQLVWLRKDQDICFIIPRPEI